MFEKTRTKVFVYGTLRPGGRYHEAYCGPFDFTGQNAWIFGQLFHFPQLGYPGATEDSDQKIHGCLLEFSHSMEEVLPKLDQLEGFDPGRPAHQNEYYRKQVKTFGLENDASTHAWCYFMEPSRVALLKGIPVPGGEWTL